MTLDSVKKNRNRSSIYFPARTSSKSLSIKAPFGTNNAKESNKFNQKLNVKFLTQSGKTLLKVNS
jgi:hypothetical protein